MEFASVFFLWVFLPLTLLLYYAAAVIRSDALRLSVRNVILLAASLLFYAWGGIKELLVPVCLILLTYGAGRLMSGPLAGSERKTGRRLVLAGSVLLLLAVLAIFKYAGMVDGLAGVFRQPFTGGRALLRSLLQLESSSTGFLSLAVPLGLSFLIFQAIAYLADVCRGTVTAEKNLLTLALYLLFFGQLTQGPILRFGDFGGQIRTRRHSLEQAAEGIRRFCWGIGKKVLIADTLGAAADAVWSSDPASLGTLQAWLGLLFYTLQIYYDFSGYTDMAIGVSGLFGFRIAENFDLPYTSGSVREFWRRWHISLSSWFRDYLYIPLGGSRQGMGRTLLNILIVFLATGIWHGADLSFLMWGLWFAVFLILERLFLGKWLETRTGKILGHPYTLLSVMLGWVLFRAPSLYHALLYFRALFVPAPDAPGTSAASLLSAGVLLAVLAGILCCGVVRRPLRGVYEKIKDKTAFLIVQYLAAILVFVWALLTLIGGSYHPSIYANF